MKVKTEDDTLLAHLSWILSSRYEDVAIEVLGFILKSTSARRVLEDLVKAGDAEIGEIVNVQTQVGGEGGTRPDLVGFNMEGNECIIIEAEVQGRTYREPAKCLP